MKKHRSPYTAHKAALRRTAKILIITMMLALFTIPGQVSAKIPDTISVGLYFVKNALYSANLQNVHGYGSGYSFGVYEEDHNGDYKSFYALASTDHIEITMLPDMNMYLSSGSFFTEQQQSNDTVIGAYHVELENDYNNYREALTEAARYPGGFVAYSHGSYYVRFGSIETYREAQDIAEDYPGSSVAGESDYGLTIVDTLTGEILFELDEGRDTMLGVVPTGNAESRTWFKGNQYNGGFRYHRPDGGPMHVENIVSLEQYVAAVLSREFVPSWPDEALKAASCCIRTFVQTSHQHSTFDVCNDICCQVYKGVYQGSQWEHLEKICRDTAGECIYYNNAPILAVYYSSNGGATVSALDAWSVDYPYLQAIYDPYESTVNTGASQWQEMFTLQELTEKARIWGFDCSSIKDVYVSEYSELGNVNAVTFVDSNGKTHTFTSEDTTLLGGTFASRRYVIIPPGGSAEVTEVLMGEGSGTGGTGTSSSHGDFAVFDGSTTVSLRTISVITANGIETISEPVEILSGSGGSAENGKYASPIFEKHTVQNNTDEYMIYGSGWGHNVGLSAYGTLAMANLGYTYQEILKFYYQNVEIK